MARKPTQRQVLDALFAKYEPEVAQAFLDAVNDITSQAELGRIVAALEVGNIEAAIQAMHIDGPAFAPVVEKAREAFVSGGAAGVASLPPIPTPEGGGLVIRFNVRNERAERLLAEQSSEFVTRIVTDQKTAVRSALQSGLEAGTNPRTAALDVIGRVNRATGRREGGILGLSSPQERYVDAARQELLSGDPKQLQNYLTRTRRDKRFDKFARDSLESGKPIPRDTASKMTGRYSDRLLQTRGEAIARTETLSALNSAHEEAMQQAIDTGEVAPQDIRKVWVATKDSRTRDSHRRIDGDSVGVNERFANGLRYPGDKSGPTKETINCRCTMLTRIDFLSNLE